MLDHDTPCAARDSGSVRMLNFIRVLLGRRHHVTFAGVESRRDGRLVDFRAGRVQMMLVRCNPSAGRPRDLSRPAQVPSLSFKCDYDLVVASRRSVAKAWLPLLRAVCPEAPVVFDTVDLHFLREIREVSVAKGYEYDATLSASENARHLLDKVP